MIYLLPLFPLMGAIVGSAINAFVPRLAQGDAKGFLTDRSRCPNCKSVLKTRHLIPVLSFLVLRGKCASCKQKISAQYLIVELISALTFTLVAYETLAHDPVDYLWLISVLILMTILTALGAYDALTHELPLVLLIPAIFIAFIIALLPGMHGLKSALIGAAVIAVFFGIQMIVITPLYKARARRAGEESPTGVVGAGDAVLGIVPGLAVGWPGVIVALFAAYLAGAIITLPLLIFGKASNKSVVAFGPFLAFGTLIGILWGEEILNFYLQHLVG